MNPVFDLTRVEDYLEVVYELIQKKGYARSADIAELLGVKSPSVTVMLQKLHAKGFIVYERYRGLTLTSSGERLARSIQQRHRTILKFLRILGVEEKIAKSDAEGIEHHVHKNYYRSHTALRRLCCPASNLVPNFREDLEVVPCEPRRKDSRQGM